MAFWTWVAAKTSSAKTPPGSKTLPQRGQTQEIQKLLGYLRENVDLMRYADFRLAGHFVGSGIVEAGCRTVVGQRLKHSGMFWSVRGADDIIALRCCHLSGRIKDFRAAAA